MTQTTIDDIAIPDLSKAETFVDGVPHAAFAALRQRPGLYWQPTEISPNRGGYWAVTRFEDIVAIEKDLTAFTSTHGAAYPGVSREPVTGFTADGLMVNDPPRHTSLRRVAATGFGPRVVANFEPWIREIVREAIDSVRDQDEFDYVDMFAKTIPAYVIGRVLGVPREDREKLIDWTTAIFVASQQEGGEESSDGSQKFLTAAMQGMAGYAMELGQYKLEHPADDMFSVMIAALNEGKLTQNEFMGWMVLMMAAGFETTHTAIGQSMRMYLEDPTVRDASDRAIDQGRSGPLADEYIRMITPAMQMARMASRDTEVAGTQVQKGDAMVLYFVSANRDSAVFGHPDDFDPWRTETATLAFGSGVHRCIGSYLAKLEVQILFEELRSSGLKLRLNGEPKRGFSNFINQISYLPVAQVR